MTKVSDKNKAARLMVVFAPTTMSQIVIVIFVIFTAFPIFLFLYKQRFFQLSLGVAYKKSLFELNFMTGDEIPIGYLTHIQILYRHP